MITHSRNITVASKSSVPPVNASPIVSDFRELPKPTFAHCFSYSNLTIFPKQKSQQFKAEWLKAAPKGFPCITQSVKKEKNMQKCRHSCYAKIAKINKCFATIRIINSITVNSLSNSCNPRCAHKYRRVELSGSYSLCFTSKTATKISCCEATKIGY